MLEVVHLSREHVMQQRLLDRALGEIRYGAATILPGEPYPLPCANVRAAPLLHPDGLREVWLADAGLTPGSAGPIRYRRSDTLLFGCMECDETAGDSTRAAQAAGAVSPLQRTVRAAYDTLLDLLDESGCPHLLRVWNYFPAINAETHGIERYRQFNIARQEALLAHGRSAAAGAPAACALGTGSGAVTIYFLASRDAPRAIENPRQVSAYHYPPEYGPRSPTFSRAALARIGRREWLFVSGTASIVGHRTAHPDDVAAQTDETLDNIEAVLAQANATTTAGTFTLRGLACKVYLRDAADVDLVRTRVERRTNAAGPTLYLLADICRRDLLVEIEATASLAIRE